MREKRNYKPTSLYVRRDLYAELKKIAEIKSIPITDAFNEAIESYVIKNKSSQ